MYLQKFYKTGFVLAALIIVPAVLFSSVLNDTTEAAVSQRLQDKLIGNYFGLDIQGHINGYFKECSGMGTENETIEHRIVNEHGDEVTVKIPGRLILTDITCSRGITSNLDIWKWRSMVEQGNANEARANGSIVMYNQQAEEMARWNFENAWPSRSISEANSQSNVEEITFVYEYIERVH